MRLSRQTEIAINILTACGKAEGRRLQTVELAKAANATRDHAAQVVYLLARHGYLTSIRGRNGGSFLTGHPGGLTLDHILRITQPELFKSGNDNAPAAALKPIVEAAFAPFLRAMEQVTIADLLDPPAAFHTRCFSCRMRDRLPGPSMVNGPSSSSITYRG